MLIGDIVISARELFPDLPSAGPAPVVTVTPAIDANGVLPPGSYTCQATYFTLWGESAPSPSVTVVLAAPNNALNFSVSSGGVSTLQGGFTVKLRAYVIAPNSGGQAFFFDMPYIPASGFSNPFNVITPGLQGTVPVRSTAFLPDTNGRFVSAGTIYRWINEALTVASYVCKGIPDVSGVQMVSGQGFYTMPGIWDKLENCWYDGFPVAFDARGGAFYRNTLSGITFICILQTNSDRQIVELQPQPSRAGGNTTLSAPIGLTDTTIPLTATSQIGLPLGMLQVGTEIVSYGSLGGGGAVGCSRGLGGTQQAAWPIGTVVKELNFRFGGLRLSQQIQYQPGQSLTSLQVPPGWAPALVDYLVGRFREAEQNAQGKGESIKAFTSFLKEYIKGTRQVAGPRQVGSVSSAGDGYPSASSGGRLIIP